jgi:tetracycline repressor-like protein
VTGGFVNAGHWFGGPCLVFCIVILVGLWGWRRLGIARASCARVSVELVRALLPLVVASDPSQRDAMIAELKAAQHGYLAPLFTSSVPRYSA